MLYLSTARTMPTVRGSVCDGRRPELSGLGENFWVAVGKIRATAIAVPVERRVVAPEDEKSVWGLEAFPSRLRAGEVLISATQ
jgi:hypothetical protein